MTKTSKLIFHLITFAFMAIKSNAYSDELAKPQPMKKRAQCVIIDHEKPIEGYDVQIFWRPHEVMVGHLIGPAIIEFTHKDSSNSFSVTNNNFGLPITNGWMTTAVIEEGYFIKSTQPHLTLQHESPEVLGQLPSTNFFFVDLNFDNKKELVVTEIANGQRFRNTYRVYETNRPHQKAMTQEPFTSLDSESVINFRNKTIHLFNAGGAFVNKELVYKFNNEQGHYVLAHKPRIDK